MEEERGHAALNAHKWNRRAETYDERRFSYMRWMQRKALSVLNLNKGVSFLDLGCGTGYAVRLVAKTLQGDGSFVGVDISPRMVEIAKSNATSLKSTYFIVSNAEELPFDDEAFEAILCTNSFHHYPSPSKALSEVYRILKPSGKICIMDVTADNMLIRLIDTRVRSKEAEHVKFYSTAEYRAMFERAGLKHVSSHTVWPPEKVHVARK